MRNILLAITSFFATVLILSQVAMAADTEDGGDPRHTISAQGEDPNLAIAKSKSGTEAGVPNAGNDCPGGTCYPRTVGGRLGDHTVSAKGTGAAGSQSSPGGGGSQNQKGSQ